MNIQEHRQGQAVILQPQGPVIGADAEQLSSQLAQVLAQTDAVVLDASEITFVDSCCLEVLVDATEKLIRNGRALKVCGCSETLQEVLELTGLASLFEHHDEITSAGGVA